MVRPLFRTRLPSWFFDELNFGEEAALSANAPLKIVVAEIEALERASRGPFGTKCARSYRKTVVSAPSQITQPSLLTGTPVPWDTGV